VILWRGNVVPLLLVPLLLAGMLVPPAALAAQTATASPAVPLEGDAPIEREIAGGEVHAYSVALESGQFLYAIVEPRGVDVTVTVTGPDGLDLRRLGGIAHLGTTASRSSAGDGTRHRPCRNPPHALHHRSKLTSARAPAPAPSATTK
jgi:hypothetical protein